MLRHKAPPQPPLVTVCCWAFNQEKYIAAALDSFLGQQAPFRFEIVVQDDASSDATPEIILQYARRFPEMIRPIIHSENQVSRGFPAFYFPIRLARGEFLAFCDGDDYWSSEEKLARQVAAMKDLGVGMSGHPAEVVSESGAATGRYSGLVIDRLERFKFSDLVKFGGNVVPMSSIMVNSSVRSDLIKNAPPVRLHTGVQLIGALRAGFCVLPEVMSVYREGVPNSATSRTLNTQAGRERAAITRLKMLERLYELSSGSERKAVEALLGRSVLELIRTSGFSKAFRAIFKSPSQSSFAGQRVFRRVALNLLGLGLKRLSGAAHPSLNSRTQRRE